MISGDLRYFHADSQSAKKMSEEGADSAPCKITTEEPGNVKSMLPQSAGNLQALPQICSGSLMIK